MRSQAPSPFLISSKLAWLLVTAAAIPAQRSATGGRVLDGDGKPLADATVTFVGSEPPIGARFAPADTVEVRTDDKGRFVVRLLPRHDYSCWAAGPADANGDRLVSRVLDVRPGTGFEIHATETASPTRVVVSGIDAWPEIGPLRLKTWAFWSLQRDERIKHVAEPPRA